jgi:hypothetical protein
VLFRSQAQGGAEKTVVKPAQPEQKSTAGSQVQAGEAWVDLDVVPPDFDDSEMPPMPDETDFGWEPPHAVQEPKPGLVSKPDPPDNTPAQAVENVQQPQPAPTTAIPEPQTIALSAGLQEQKKMPLTELDATVLSPAVRTTPSSGKGEPPKMVTVLLHSSGDSKRDVLRLRCIHGALVSSPGLDRFNFQVYENGRKFSLDFPNDSTGINPELITRLVKLAGEENLRIDPIQ